MFMNAIYGIDSHPFLLILQSGDVQYFSYFIDFSVEIYWRIYARERENGERKRGKEEDREEEIQINRDSIRNSSEKLMCWTYMNK